MARSRTGAIVVLGMLLLGCSLVPPYFEIGGGIDQSAPATVGETIYVGVASLRSREGDAVVLRSLELVDPALGAADVEGLVVDMRKVEGDAIGIVQASDPMTSAEAVAALAPLEGYRFTADEAWHPISIVTAITSPEAGDVRFESIRIGFRVNGGPPQIQEIPSGVRLCFGDPRPEAC